MQARTHTHSQSLTSLTHTHTLANTYLNKCAQTAKQTNETRFFRNRVCKTQSLLFASFKKTKYFSFVRIVFVNGCCNSAKCGIHFERRLEKYGLINAFSEETFSDILDIEAPS